MKLSYKVIRVGDNKRGVGAIVERRTLFGTRTTWTFEGHELPSLDRWTCSETGEKEYIGVSPIHSFYVEQFEALEAIHT